MVSRFPADLSRYRHNLIDQGYLAVETGRGSMEIRLRRTDDRWTLTIKKGTASIRLENEMQLRAPIATKLWPFTKGVRVSKMRYRIPYRRRLTIELDIYRGAHRGLAVAEVEFASVSMMKRFTPPDWFGREVTGKKKYFNSSLASRGNMRQLQP
ncbi:MAG: CYTH domain-containing protein [Phycisphaerales bacterium]